jgi:hypothetical protein
VSFSKVSSESKCSSDRHPRSEAGFINCRRRQGSKPASISANGTSRAPGESGFVLSYRISQEEMPKPPKCDVRIDIKHEQVLFQTPFGFCHTFTIRPGPKRTRCYRTLVAYIVLFACRCAFCLDLRATAVRPGPCSKMTARSPELFRGYDGCVKTGQALNSQRGN